MKPSEVKTMKGNLAQPLCTAALLSFCLLALSAQAPAGAQSINPSPIGVDNEIELQLPSIFTNPQVPTDFSGPAGSLGHAQGLRQRLLGPEAEIYPRRKTTLIVSRDPRFVYGPSWMPFIQSGLAVIPRTNTFSAVIETPGSLRKTTIKEAAPVLVKTTDALPTNARFLPTKGTIYSITPLGHLNLDAGAVVVKAGEAPVTVSTLVAGRPVAVNIGGNAIAVVSTYDDRFSVLNLLDEQADAVSVYISEAGITKTSPVRLGRLFEVFPTGRTESAHALVGQSPMILSPLSNGLTVATYGTDFPRALKRFNLTNTLSAADMNRILKSAAAIAYVDNNPDNQ
jgi:hypothetical protein